MTHQLKAAFLHFARNERWGTCGSCPLDADGAIYPEMCVNTARCDHQFDLQGLVTSYAASGRADRG